MVITDIKRHRSISYDFSSSPKYDNVRTIYLICLASIITSLCFLLIVAVLKDWSSYWNSYRKCLLGLLLTSLMFGVFNVSNEAHLESVKGKWNLGVNFCILWHALSKTVQDTVDISIISLNIDRTVSLLKPQVYMSKCFEYSIHIGLNLMGILSALINLIVMFLNFNNAHQDFIDNHTCHLLRDIIFPHFSLVLLIFLLLSAIVLVVANSKGKYYPPLKIDDKNIGCVMPILLADFSVVFLRLAPRIVEIILIRKTSGLIVPYFQTIEMFHFLNYADWSSFLLPPFLLLFDANIIKSIKNIFTCGRRSRKFEL